MWPRGLWPAGLLCPRDPPGKSPGVGCLAFLQGIFLTQGLNPYLLHCRQILYCWTTREALNIYILKFKIYKYILTFCGRAKTLHFNTSSNSWWGHWNAYVYFKEHLKLYGGLFNGHSDWGPPEHLVQRFAVTGIYCLFIWGGADAITIEIKCTKNVMHLNHPETVPPPPGLWRICLLHNWSLAPKRLGFSGCESEMLNVSRCVVWQKTTS